MRTALWVPAILFTTLLAPTPKAPAQQVPDTLFRFRPSNPAFAEGAGPVVCVDSGHRNLHTIEGQFGPFAQLLREDGYRVEDHATTLDAATLAICSVLVIANAGRVDGPPPPGYPHLSAFTKPEHDALLQWVLGGGALWLFVDHPPYPGAMSGVASLLGFQFFDGYAGPSSEWPTANMVFGEIDEAALRRTTEAFGIPHDSFREMLGEPGILTDHVILRGRTAEEVVNRVVTFTGSAFLPSEGVQPLLVLGPQAAGVVVLAGNVPDASPSAYPLFSLGEWLVGGVRQVGEGRVAVIAEAAVCTAQLAGTQRVPAGINMPFASQNAQFCLNVARWLTGVLPPSADR